VKKETIITAAVFCLVGFLAGYITNAQISSTRQNAVAAGGPSRPSAAPDSAGADANIPTPGEVTSALPEGHPPINTAPIVQTLKDQAAKNPNDPGPLLKLANFLYDHRQFGQSIEWYQRALEINPKNVNARTDLGTAYFYSGQYQDALTQYRKSIAQEPRHEQTLFNMVIVNLEGIHDLKAAQDAWDRLHQVNPNNPGLDDLKRRLDAARAAGGGPQAAR
jgi:tetratricopeptide (TPR) repeat protein